jgi:pimeloyl-ACP methyl ester carboxylesterase
MSFGSAVAITVERLVEPVEGMHRAISGRWFSAMGRVGKPVQLAHDTVSRIIYESIRFAGAVAGTGLDIAMDVRPKTTSRAQAFTNGLWGDKLGRHEARLGIPMGLRDRNGAPLELGPEINRAFPAASEHLVLLAHGFMDTEQFWHVRKTSPSLLETLEGHPSLTPLTVRYNTGRPISANGALLADLVEAVHANWPVPVQSIALVGHSAGGLVIRSACAAAQENGQEWIAKTTNVVTLGSPHLGTPLERLAELATQGLNVAKETRPLAEFLNTRSRGITDLRFGTTGDVVPADVDQHFVAGIVTADPSHPAGVLMGDLVVGVNSASGGQELDPANVMVVGGVRHNDLVDDSAVVGQVMDWLEPGAD